MPIYEYQCESCGHHMEALQKISDAALETCPSCHKDELKKLISAAAFKLKGSGWYETDFKNKKDSKTGNGKNAAGNDSAGGEKPAGTDSKGKKADNGSSSSSSGSSAKSDN